jgi:hypothetical protein
MEMCSAHHNPDLSHSDTRYREKLVEFHMDTFYIRSVHGTAIRYIKLEETSLDVEVLQKTPTLFKIDRAYPIINPSYKLQPMLACAVLP